MQLAKHLFILILLFLTTGLYAQNSNNDFLPSTFRVSYIVSIDTASSMSMEYPENVFRNTFAIEKYSDRTLASYVVDKVLSGDINAYKTFGSNEDELYSIEDSRLIKTISDCQRDLGKFKDTVYMEDLETGYMLESVIEHEIDISEIKAFMFYEDWSFDADVFRITKNVVGYDLIRYHFNYSDDERRHRCFSVFPAIDITAEKQEEAEKRMVKVANLTYEYFLYNQEAENEFKDCDGSQQYVFENPTAPHFNSYARSLLIGTMMDKLENGDLYAYDIYENYPLTYKDIAKRLGEGTEIVDVINEYGEEMKVEIVKEINPKFEIKSIMFTENIYIDPETLLLKKEVVAIAPVRCYYNENDKLVKKVLFKIPLD